MFVMLTIIAKSYVYVQFMQSTQYVSYFSFEETVEPILKIC